MILPDLSIGGSMGGDGEEVVGVVSYPFKYQCFDHFDYKFSVFSYNHYLA